jgi:hypothetical protein
MSDVIVSTTESTTNVTTVNDVTTIAITNNVVEVSQATAGLQGVPGSNSDPTYVFVTNKTGATLAKGSIVYVSGANGVHTQVSLALATGDITSARTLGWLSENIANNATGLCCVEGYLDGVDTQGVTEGAQLYLSPTIPGAFTETKPVASDHLVYVGVCAKASAGNGRVFVKVQNGYELNELHDVKTVNLANNDLLRYSASTALWENVAATAITVGSAITAGTSVYATNAATSVYASTSGTSVYATNAGTAVGLSGSITKSQVSDFTSGTVASASTAQQAGTAVYATTSGSASVSGSAVAYTGSITISQITDLANATVTSASTAQQAGTSVYASTAGTSVYATLAGTSVYATAALSATSSNSAYTALLAGTSVYAATSGTADYATTSGTSVSISGSITRSQVSDFASGTVANISGTVTQTQVANLTTDLAGKANLAGGNSFTGAQIVASSGTASIPLVVRGTAGQSANLTEWQSSTGSTAASLSISSGLFVKGAASGNLIGNFQTNTGTTAVRIFDRSSYADVELIQSTLYTGLQTYIYGAGDYGAALNVVTRSTANAGVIVRGRASQSANLQSWQISDSTETTRVRSGGQIGIGSLITGTTMAINTDTVGGASSKGLVVRGASGQTNNLQEWQASDGGTAARVTSSGSLVTTQGFAVLGGASISGSIATLLQTSNAARIALVVQGAASQSANLQEWQNSAGGTVARVNNLGEFFAPIIWTTNAYAGFTEQSAGGALRMTKLTAAGSNPGAGNGRIYFRDGTNAGTLKLVVRAGAAGAETTILDNIPQ